ncbi:MAG: hypothetical protein R3B07_35435 [Polyangiaceae bacterium]
MSGSAGIRSEPPSVRPWTVVERFREQSALGDLFQSLGARAFEQVAGALGDVREARVELKQDQFDSIESPIPPGR